MEKIMSKTNDTSKLGPATQVQELRDDELQKVSGGAMAEKDFVVAYLDTTLRSAVPALLKGPVPSVGGRGICPFPDVC